MSALPQAVSNAPPIPRPVLSSVANNTPLTRVSLAFVERRINLYLRFGHPVRELRLDRWRRCAVFLPTALFCRVRWESNDYGTTRWQLMVLQAGTPLDAVQRIAGIQPGARLLLHAEGEQQVQSVLPQIAYHLARFLTNVRSLSIDPIIVRQNWLEAYDYTTDKGAATLNDYARTNDPFARIGQISTAVEITSVVRASESSFQVRWIERNYANGSPSGTERWTAVLSVVLQPPRTEERLRKNPLGIYINGLSWSRELDATEGVKKP